MLIQGQKRTKFNQLLQVDKHDYASSLKRLHLGVQNIL